MLSRRIYFIYPVVVGLFQMIYGNVLRFPNSTNLPTKIASDMLAEANGGIVNYI